MEVFLINWYTNWCNWWWISNKIVCLKKRSRNRWQTSGKLPSSKYRIERREEWREMAIIIDLGCYKLFHCTVGPMHWHSVHIEVFVHTNLRNFKDIYFDCRKGRKYASNTMHLRDLVMLRLCLELCHVFIHSIFYEPREYYFTPKGVVENENGGVALLSGRKVGRQRHDYGVAACSRKKLLSHKLWSVDSLLTEL